MLKDSLQISRRSSWTVIIFLILATACTTLLHQQGFSLQEAGRLNSLTALLGSAVFAAAGPILIRTLSYQKSLKEEGMSIESFRRMKRISLISVSAGVMFALYAILVPVYRYHLYLSVLLAIYGIYSVLPIRQSDVHDLKAFGVRGEEI